MQDSSITCPNCQHKFNLSDELKKHLEAEQEKRFQSKLKELKNTQEEQQTLLKKEKEKIEQESKALKEAIQNQEKQVLERLETEKRKLWAIAQTKAEEKINKENETRFKDLEEQNKERSKQLEEAQKKELEFLKQKREFEEKSKNQELELQRKLGEESQKITEQLKKESEEAHRLKMLEKDKQMEQLRKSLDEAQRRAEQGSMQIQGDVQEDDLRDMLRAAFLIDVIEDVPTGTRGADLIHTVRNSLGHKAGTILWESKNTKEWTEAWVQKLKDDQAALGADIAILATKTLPKDVQDYEYRNGVWVVSHQSVMILVSLLRHHLIEVGKVKNSLQGQDEKMQMLFEYLSSPQFKNRIENIMGAFESMKTDLDKEKRAMQTIWNRREKELERVMINTSGFYGDLQGIAGTGIPTIEAFELPDGEL